MSKNCGKTEVLNNISSVQQELATALKQASAIIKMAHSVCILTGAGISAESGIPTFRDKQTGLWEKYRAEDLANIDAFERDPKTVWSWYQWRRGLVADKKPNPAHFALTDLLSWATHHSKEVTLITQNVDDLHEQARSKAIHLHGHLWQNKCSSCDKPFEEDIDFEQLDLQHCLSCNGLIRPDIVWFGEMLPQQQWTQAEIAASHCDVFISIGTSSLVYPAAGLSQLAKQNGASIIEINLTPTHSPAIDMVLEGKAGEILPKLVDLLR